MKRRTHYSCSKCRKKKVAAQFNKRSAGRAGWVDSDGQRRQSMCRSCQKWDKLERRYGITRVEYEQMLEQQNESCAICGKHRSECVRQQLHLDHNHETGAVRGLLCQACNHGVGNFYESVEYLANAITYLHRYDNPEPSPD